MSFLGNRYLVCTFCGHVGSEILRVDYSYWQRFGCFLSRRWDWAWPRCWSTWAWDSLLLLFLKRKPNGLQYWPGRIPRHSFVTFLTLEKREYASFSTATTHGFLSFSLCNHNCTRTCRIVFPVVINARMQCQRLQSYVRSPTWSAARVIIMQTQLNQLPLHR